MPSSTSSRHGQMPKRLRVGPGNVPERDDGGARQALAHHLRQQREVIVLHQHDRVVGARLVRDHVGEAPVHRLVVLPVRRRGRSAACARCGRAATGPRWRSRSSSPAPPPSTAIRGGCGTTAFPAAPSRGRACRRCRGRPSRRRARSRCPSTRASPARARSPGRSPGAGSRSRCPCAARAGKARGSTRSGPRRPSGPGAGCGAARRGPRWSGSRRASGARSPGRSPAPAGRARSGAARGPRPWQPRRSASAAGSRPTSPP